MNDWESGGKQRLMSVLPESRRPEPVLEHALDFHQWSLQRSSA